MKLAVEERDRIFKSLNSEQKQYLDEMLFRGRRTVFANVLAREKGAMIPADAPYEVVEHLLDDWIYVGFHDAGIVTPELRCECGRPLRYQHIVEHKQTGEFKKFGITHLKEHMNLDAKTVKAIIEGFDKIDYELDEILYKIDSSWSLDDERVQPLSGIVIPHDIQRHFDLGLPLLQTQINKLQRLANTTLLQAQARNPKYVRPAQHVTVSFQPQFIFEDEPSSDKSANVLLSSDLHSVVLEYLQQNIYSARVICEKLLLRDGVSDGRYITGKPHIYVSVCFYLDDLVQKGKCLLIQSSYEDRYYQYNN